MYLMRIGFRILNLDRVVDAEYRPEGPGESGDVLRSRIKVRFSVEVWDSLNAVMLTGGQSR